MFLYFSGGLCNLTSIGQAVLTAVEYSMATTSLSGELVRCGRLSSSSAGYLLQETTALLHCLDSIATCCHIFGPDLSEVVVQVM